ncbi:pyruvate kinase [Candidatus Woesearchaeota archaeon]|nr:pyruvate kinase [Candidatus Woesearchaeota archaeon]
MENNIKNTKIICTIGPASDDLHIMQNMYKAGMDAVRINTAHGDFKSYSSILKKVRKAGDITTMIDIKGPELRIRCEQRYEFPRRTDIIIGDASHAITFNYNIISNLKKGDIILIEDGKYRLKIISKKNNYVIAHSEEHCIIEPNKNVHLPGKKIKLPSLTKKDIKAVKFCIDEKIDYIALSFCRSKHDIINLRNRLGESGIKIIAKIENSEGIENIIEIIDEADGIMVARGDLGVVLSLEKVPLVQKMIIRECNEKGKLVIVATQMLESMINNPIPTRAEISDVANAILDGADCIMLSAETAVGKYPVKAIEYMTKAALNIEHAVPERDPVKNKNVSVSEALSHCVEDLCDKIDFTKVVCLTHEGHSAIRVSRFRINKPIIAVTSTKQLQRQLNLYYGIHATITKSNFEDPSTTELVKELYDNHILEKDDTIILTAGLRTLNQTISNTNTLLIRNVKEVLKYTRKYGTRRRRRL